MDKVKYTPLLNEGSQILYYMNIYSVSLSMPAVDAPNSAFTK